MGEQVIRQPNARYAIYDIDTGTITAWDLTGTDVVNRAVAHARDETQRTLDHIDNDRAHEVYRYYAMSWGEAVSVDRGNGGSVGVQYAAAETGETGDAGESVEVQVGELMPDREVTP